MHNPVLRRKINYGNYYHHKRTHTVELPIIELFVQIFNNNDDARARVRFSLPYLTRARALFWKWKRLFCKKATKKKKNTSFVFWLTRIICFSLFHLCVCSLRVPSIRHVREWIINNFRILTLLLLLLLRYHNAMSYTIVDVTLVMSMRAAVG